MADYGAILLDEKGRRFARVDGGDSYHYWGRVDLTGLLGQYPRIPLFNIPVSIPICVFIFCEFLNDNWRDRLGTCQVRQENGVWIGRMNRGEWPGIETSLKSVSFYVFVPARYVPSSIYGIQCFSEQGIKVYDSARPLLQIAGVGAGGVLTTGSATFFNRTPVKTASAYSVQASVQFIVINGTAYYGAVYYFGTYTTGGLAGYTGMFESFGNSGSPSDNRPFSNIPLIDAAYYDQFTNLGNM